MDIIRENNKDTANSSVLVRYMMNGYGVLITRSGVRLGGEWVNDKPGPLKVLHESSDGTDTE